MHHGGMDASERLGLAFMLSLARIILVRREPVGFRCSELLNGSNGGDCLLSDVQLVDDFLKREMSTSVKKLGMIRDF